MIDRELLELAAKAAGIEWIYEECDIFYLANPLRPWNPLTDDGDALRLAVKLRIHVRHFPNDVEAQVERGYWRGYWREDNGDEPYAATRRAIVRAAAEIGKGMK